MSTDLSPLELLTSLSLVGLAVVLSWWRGLGLERSVLWSSLRALIQMVLIGLALAVVLDPGAPVAWSWLWVGGMIVFAAETTVYRTAEVDGLRPTVYASFVSASIVSLGVVFGLGVFDAVPRAIVPIGGMVIGNILTVSVLVARRVVDEIAVRHEEIEARLALGLGSREAALPYVRVAVRDAMLPQLERTKAIGIVFLPGTMTGLILAGVDPLDAVLIQVVVMYLVLGAAAVGALVTAQGTSARLFSDDHRLLLGPEERAS